MFLILKSIPDVLEVNKLLWAKQIRIIVSEFQDVRLLSGVEDEADIFLKFHRDDVNDLVCGLEKRHIVQGKEAFFVDLLSDRGTSGVRATTFWAGSPCIRGSLELHSVI